MSRMLRYYGIFDLGGLISTVTDWFDTRGWEIVIKKVKHKKKTFGLVDEWWYKGWRDETEFHRLIITANIYLWDYNEVEVLVNNERKKLYKGRIWIEIDGKIDEDPYGRFDTSAFMVMLKKFMYDKVLFHYYSSIWGDRLDYKITEIQLNLKEFLDFQSLGKYYKNMW